MEVHNKRNMHHYWFSIYILCTSGSGVDSANEVCSACIKHQRDLHAQCALYPVYSTGGSFEVWLQRDINIYNFSFIASYSRHWFALRLPVYLSTLVMWLLDA